MSKWEPTLEQLIDASTRVTDAQKVVADAVVDEVLLRLDALLAYEVAGGDGDDSELENKARVEVLQHLRPDIARLKD